MIVAVDETTSWVVARILDQVFSDHEFVSITKDLGLSGSLDPDLIETLAARDIDMLLTADIDMLDEHRDDLRSSGMHWLGITQVRVPGEAGLAFLAASALAALPGIFADIEQLHESERAAFKIKRLGIQPGQRYSKVEF